MTVDEAAAENSEITLDDAWHSAEAYHFYILAQKLLIQNQYEAAMRACLHLRNFTDVISPLTIYSLLALSSFHCQFFKQCSLALQRLEQLPEVKEKDKEIYKGLGFKIFSRVPPTDPRELRETRKQPRSRLSSKRDICLLTARYFTIYRTD